MVFSGILCTALEDEQVVTGVCYKHLELEFRIAWRHDKLSKEKRFSMLVSSVACSLVSLEWNVLIKRNLWREIMQKWNLLILKLLTEIVR